MAVSLSKKRSSSSSKAAAEDVVERPGRDYCCLCSVLCKVLYRIPVAVLLLFLLFLWSSSTTIISGKIVHVCVSSRKLNNLYCLSAGAQSQPSFELPEVPVFRNISRVLSNDEDITKETAGAARESSLPVLTFSGIPSIDRNSSKAVSSVVPENPVPVPVPIIKTSVEKEPEEDTADAMKAVKEQLDVHRSWVSSHSGNNMKCDGKGIYVYDLPSKFNKDLIGQCSDIVPWIDFCKYFENNAMGEPIPKLGDHWYGTHQYSLEPIFHSRILKHPCRVYNENEAKLFYVPFYGGLDILRWHFKNVSTELKDSLSLELIKWLEQQKLWTKNSGKDHVFVLGKISWDFRRNSDSTWGTKFLELPQMQNPVKLLIERQPWHVNDIGIPHPTSFHPQSDSDIIAWQQKIIQSPRRSLISFAGAARPGAPENIRSVLIRQCMEAGEGKCRYLDCRSEKCDMPETVIETFMESEFCLQPQGDSPTRKSLFDSLVSGCIPVLFDPFTAYYQYPWHLPEEPEKYSVFIDHNEVRKSRVNVMERLMKISRQEREDMRSYIVYKLMPGLVYGDPSSEFSKFQDAFFIAVNNLLERASRI
ncbi:hypothetical protein CDL15_Pgr017916 [Punica granatum]|uniref:Exostosin GT47 domain-containing protein n=1 Tax=Punica granatum TaxID=22663 RepID=A0A218WHJ8_PUNGR|nr:hypothetical protein CDL15_Pgr017916 [Punica granatum]